jgi:hypothetical protein
MRGLLPVMLLVLLPVLIWAQSVLEISAILVTDLGNGLYQIEVSVRNLSNKTISEIGGKLDFLDRTGRIVAKTELNVLLKSDIPLKPKQATRRSLVISQPADLSGSFRYRITALRFEGETEYYLLCPNCGEAIPKE